MVPVVLTRKQQGEKAWAPITERVRATLPETLGNGPVTLELHAWLTVGKRGV